MNVKNWMGCGLVLAALLPACDDGGPGEPTGPTLPEAEPLECERVVSPDDCDESLRPIVFIHGTFGAGDNIAHVAKLFGSNGYCQERLVAIDYDSLGEDPTAKVDAAIDAVLEAYPKFDKVDLMGHSQGAGHGYSYISDPERAKRVEHYIHLAGRRGTAPAGVKVLTLASRSDVTATEPIEQNNVIEGGQSHIFDELDHMAVASSTEAFIQMWKFLMGEDPEFTEVQCGDETVMVGGVAETFGDNVAKEGVRVEFYEQTGDVFERGEPALSVTAGEGGVLEPQPLKRGVPYESVAYEDGEVVGRQYFGAFMRDDYLTRALLPSSGLLTAPVTNLVERSDDHMALIARTARGAFRKDLGDSLVIDGEEMLLEEIADAVSTTVAYFMFDGNGNQESDLEPLTGYGIIPFVEGVDAFFDARQDVDPPYLTVEYNGQTLYVPRWPSESEGLVLLMFQ